MKPGDALIIEGETHLVVASENGYVSVQHPDGTMSKYDQYNLGRWLCASVPHSIKINQSLADLKLATEKLRKELDNIRKTLTQK